VTSSSSGSNQRLDSQRSDKRRQAGAALPGKEHYERFEALNRASQIFGKNGLELNDHLAKFIGTESQGPGALPADVLDVIVATTEGPGVDVGQPHAKLIMLVDVTATPLVGDLR
jgi:hypothetical protein